MLSSVIDHHTTHVTHSMLSLKDHGCYQDLKFWFEISEIPPLTEMLISRPKLSVFLQIFMNLVKFYSNPFKIVKISKKKIRTKKSKISEISVLSPTCGRNPTFEISNPGCYTCWIIYDELQL